MTGGKKCDTEEVKEMIAQPPDQTFVHWKTQSLGNPSRPRSSPSDRRAKVDSGRGQETAVSLMTKMRARGMLEDEYGVDTRIPADPLDERLADTSSTPVRKDIVYENTVDGGSRHNTISIE
ncbi:2638_t:CDS:2, partial [Paraglomus occultum]